MLPARGPSTLRGEGSGGGDFRRRASKSLSPSLAPIRRYTLRQAQDACLDTAFGLSFDGQAQDVAQHAAQDALSVPRVA